MALADHITALIALVVRIVEPAPPPRSILDFRASLRITEGPAGPRPERPDGDFLGDERHFIQELACMVALRFRRTVILGPPQEGKDTGIAVPLMLWALIEARRPVAYCTTDRQLADKLYRAKMHATAVRSGYSWALPDEGRGSEGGTPGDQLFQTGVWFYLLGSGSKSGGGQAGITAWLVVITEADKIRAQQLRWLEDRNASYQDDARTVLLGTLDRENGRGLYAEHAAAIKIIPHYPCPHCCWFQTWEWEAVDLDRGCLVCVACKEPIDDAQRRAALPQGVAVIDGQSIDPATGTITGEAGRGVTGAIRYSALDCPRRSLSGMIALYREAEETYERTGDDTKMREFELKELVRLPKAGGRVLELRPRELAVRAAAAPYRRTQAPAGFADGVVIAIDVQLRRLLWSAVIFDRATERWAVIDHGRLAICGDGETPSEAQRHRGFDTIAGIGSDGWALPSGHILRARAGVIDTSDGNTQSECLSWIKNRPGWYAIKGEKSRSPVPDLAEGTAILRVPGVLAVYRQDKAHSPYDLFIINVNAVKTRIYRSLSIAATEPGAGMIPAGEAADGELIKELCAERQEQTDDGPVWVQIYRHNHRLDTTTYAVAWHLYQKHVAMVAAGANPNQPMTAAEYAQRIGSPV